jgi:hypothetical protein
VQEGEITGIPVDTVKDKVTQIKDIVSANSLLTPQDMYDKIEEIMEDED